MIYDFIVIGSGFGGSVASLRLAEKGYSVLTIEQGKRFNPTDFPKTNWKKSLFGGKMKIDNRGHKKVPAFIPIGQEVMERYARKVSGIPQNILLEVFFNRPTTAHILGGCPMSENAQNGVIDNELKVHGYPDFFITDGSVIQGNIGVNPSLTITAMAEYCMSRIPSKENAGIKEISKQLMQLEEEWKKKKYI